MPAAAALDLDAVIALVEQVAGQVHRPLFRTGVAAEQKAPGDLVSRVDREAEALLTTGLQRLTPAAVVVGEEAVAADPSLTRALQGAAPVWLVDPLDGTSAYLSGSPDHAVMVALVDRGQTVAAVVHLPEHGRTYAAERGSGTWSAGQRLAAGPATEPLRGAVLRRYLDQPTRACVDENAWRFGDLTPHSTCAGVEYARLLDGEADFLLFWRTLPWDHAPGALLLSEAGGDAVRPDRSPYRPDDERRGLLAVSDTAIADRVLTDLGLG